MRHSWVLMLAGLGCLAAGGQVLFVRECLVLFAGNELSLGCIFACWFVGIALGAALGGRTANAPGRALTGVLIVACLLVLASFVLLTLLRIWREIAGGSVGQHPSLGDLLLCGSVAITPFGLLIGLAFPLACRALVDHEGDALVVGRVYVAESAGAVLGGLTIGVLAAGRLAPFESMALVSLPLLVGLTWTGWAARQRLAVLGAIVCSAVCGLWISGLLFVFEERSSLWRFDALQTGGERIAWADTAYQHLDLAVHGGQYNLFSNGKLTVSFPDPYSARPRAHLVMCQHILPKSVLLLGPAFAGFVPTALAHPIERLDLVEIDPGVGQLVEGFLDAEDEQALSDPRVHRHLTDGRRFLRQSVERWDLIFSDSPDPLTASLNRFYTKEFFAQVHEHLAEGGVYATRVSSGVNYLGFETADLVRGLQTTLRSIFAHALVIPGQETFLFASDRRENLLGAPELLAQRYENRGVRDPRFTHHQFNGLTQADLVFDLQAQLTARGQELVNTDDKPVTYLQSVLVWSHMAADPTVLPLRLLIQLPIWAWFALAFALPGAVAVWILPRRVAPARRVWRALALAIGLVGALGMALELTLSFAYQSLAGSLYQEIGLIVAAFMAGLVFGGVWTQRRLSRRPAGPAALGAVLLALSILAAALPWLQSSAWLAAIPLWLAQGWLLLLVLLAGVGTGVVFPLASQIALRAGAPLGQTSGSLDAWDHLGAALGALTSGVVLVPVLGRTLTCLLLACFCGLTGLLLLAASSGWKPASPTANA